MANDFKLCPLCAIQEWAKDNPNAAVWAAVSLGFGGQGSIIQARKELCPTHLENAARDLDKAGDLIDAYQRKVDGVRSN